MKRLSCAGALAHPEALSFFCSAFAFVCIGTNRSSCALGAASAEFRAETIVRLVDDDKTEAVVSLSYCARAMLSFACLELQSCVSIAESVTMSYRSGSPSPGPLASRCWMTVTVSSDVAIGDLFSFRIVVSSTRETSNQSTVFIDVTADPVRELSTQIEPPEEGVRPGLHRLS